MIHAEKILRTVSPAALACVLLLIAGVFAQEESDTTPNASSESDRLWSLRRLEKIAVPESEPGWARSPIDIFIQQTYHDKQFAPSPEADRRTLLRRLSFDLLGLPPAWQEFQDFSDDHAPDAYERLTDRLLANPHLGERWARHWMDVVHFAETHGHDQDRIRPNAWPYRDYLIHAWNEDRLYPRFVQDQIAGDVLFPDDAWSLIATGFLATGPWDESSLMSIQDDTDDRKIAQYIDRDDIVTTAMGTFVSLTVHCARCHDHKFDPITQDDYYSLQAVFAGVDKAERAYDVDPEVGRQRRTLQNELTRLDQLPADNFLTSDLQARVSEWEAQAQAAAHQWVAVTPIEVRSEQGSELVIQPDGSVLSQGNKPDTDTYTLRFRVDFPEITGLRLETLTDDSLPLKGPGRQDNGNLHLSEIRVEVADASQRETKTAVVLAKARADFDQSGWTIQHAIDNKPDTAWGIHPEVGKPHDAVFEFAQPAVSAAGSILTVTLDQLHGRNHLIGRPRISLTAAKSPLSHDVLTLPTEISTILAVSPAERSEEHRVQLGRFVRRQELTQALKELPPQQMVFTANREFQPNGGFKPSATPRSIHVLRRGDIRQPGAEAVPGALACVTELPARFSITDITAEGERRAALANWLSAPDNGIVWRSLVNRIWHYHFGRGIVDTPSDFGAMSYGPSHPELLDWLADDFRSHGGSIKRLHRQLITSAVYRQAVGHRPEFAAKDGSNEFLWRANRRRLEAEEIRDAALVFAERFDDRMEGPSVRQFTESPGVQITPVLDYLGFDPDKPEHTRRSVYRFLYRTLPDPYHAALDCPDSSQWAPVRNESLTALQALALLHDRLLIRLCDHLAESITTTASTPDPQMKELYHRVLLRDPTTDDSSAMLPYIQQHGLPNTCRMLLNANEFLYVE